MPSEVVRAGGRTEVYRQIPLDDGYWTKLAERAARNDRVPVREASRILKDVLDGQYWFTGEGIGLSEISPHHRKVKKDEKR